MTFDVTPKVPCLAVVDRLDQQVGGGSWQWRVTVRTAPFWPFQRTAIYFIEAPSDTLAAQAGIRRFEEEAKRPKLITTVH